MRASLTHRTDPGVSSLFYVPGLSLFIIIIFRTLVRLWTYLRTETALPQFLFTYVDSELVILLYLFIASSALVIIDHDQHKNE